MIIQCLGQWSEVPSLQGGQFQLPRDTEQGKNQIFPCSVKKGSSLMCNVNQGVWGKTLSFKFTVQLLIAKLSFRVMDRLNLRAQILSLFCVTFIPALNHCVPWQSRLKSTGVVGGCSEVPSRKEKIYPPSSKTREKIASLRLVLSWHTALRWLFPCAALCAAVQLSVFSLPAAEHTAPLSAGRRRAVNEHWWLTKKQGEY